MVLASIILPPRKRDRSPISPSLRPLTVHVGSSVTWKIKTISSMVKEKDGARFDALDTDGTFSHLSAGWASSTIFARSILR
jgi:hypothetical protein